MIYARKSFEDHNWQHALATQTRKAHTGQFRRSVASKTIKR